VLTPLKIVNPPISAKITKTAILIIFFVFFGLLIIV
jgi:hypothetical protein